MQKIDNEHKSHAAIPVGMMHNYDLGGVDML
jgi:3-hydroxyacyl-CoA dehydrogenase